MRRYLPLLMTAKPRASFGSSVSRRCNIAGDIYRYQWDRAFAENYSVESEQLKSLYGKNHRPSRWIEILKLLSQSYICKNICSTYCDITAYLGSILERATAMSHCWLTITVSELRVKGLSPQGGIKYRHQAWQSIFKRNNQTRGHETRSNVIIIKNIYFVSTALSPSIYIHLESAIKISITRIIK